MGSELNATQETQAHPPGDTECPGCHRLVHPSEWVWLPTARRGTLARHPWCRACGEVKMVGAERAYDLGGLMNVLARLERRLAEHGLRVTEAQRRLIVRKLQDASAVDTFGLTRDVQMDYLIQTVGACLGIHPKTVATYLYARH